MNNGRAVGAHVRTALTAIAVAGFAVFIAAVVIGPQVGDLRWSQVHHAYLGVLLVLAGVAGLSVLPTSCRRLRGFAWVLAALGTIAIVDDAFQHVIQRWAGRPEYRSPLHRLYGASLWKIPAIAELNRWLDRLLGSSE